MASREEREQVFLGKLKEKWGDEYELVGEYLGGHIPTNIKHNTCGREFIKRPSYLLQTQECTHCSKEKTLKKKTKTTDQFKKDLYEKYGDEYEVLSEYIDSRVKIHLWHNSPEGGHELWKTPNSILTTNSRCGVCYGNQKKTNKQFLKEVYDAVGNEYTVLGEYDGANKKIKFKHEKCGHEYNVEPSVFINMGCRCPKCAGKCRTAESFKKEIFDLTNGEYEALGNYKKAREKIIFKHNSIECDFNEFLMPPDSFLAGHRCPRCQADKRGLQRRVSPEVFEKRFKEIAGEEYKLLSPYIKCGVDLDVLHTSDFCGETIFKVKPEKVLQKGIHCPVCLKEKMKYVLLKSQEDFEQEVLEKTYGNFSVISDYKGVKEDVLLYHHDKKCPNPYIVTKPNDFLRALSCGHCKSSKGEQRILRWLNYKGILNQHNRNYGDLKHEGKLRFDHLIYDNNGILKCIIEFDGEQHFKPISFGASPEKTEENFKSVQHKDKIKDQFCEENNIKLIRIPYWEFNIIEEILEKELRDLL